MRLTSTDGAIVEMRVVRYQFPNSSGDGSRGDADANWLIIGGQVSTHGVTWSFEDPCLLTTEASALGTWLRLVADGTGSSPAPWTIEPNLAFDVVDRSESGVTIRVTFRQESAPPGIGEDVRFDSGFAVDVTMNPVDLVGCADDWAAELLAYPPR